MNNLFITAASRVSENDLRGARMGSRFGRLDLLSKLAVCAVECLGIGFEAISPGRVGICLAAKTGSLSTDIEYWNRRDAVGGPSPTLFAYTLPSAAIGEIAIRYRLTGPGLCLVGGDEDVLEEACDWIERGEVDGCVCVSCDHVSAAAAQWISAVPVAAACALFVTRGTEGLRVLRENDRDMQSICAVLCARNAAR